MDGPNLYRYSRNAPIVLADPHGTQPPDPRLFATFEEFVAASSAPYSAGYLTQIWEQVQSPLFTPAEISGVVNNLEHMVKAVGQGLRETITRLDIDEPNPVSRGGAWDDSANKQFMERLTNQQTKNAGIGRSTTPARPRISLAQAARQGPEAFRQAANEMLTSRFSGVQELDQITREARGAMRNLNRPKRELTDAINESIRGRIARGATAETQLMQRALREVGINPQTLSASHDPPSGAATGARMPSVSRAATRAMGRPLSATRGMSSTGVAGAAFEMGFYGILLPKAVELMFYFAQKLDKIGGLRWLNRLLPNYKEGTTLPRSDVEIMEHVMRVPTTWSLGFF